MNSYSPSSIPIRTFCGRPGSGALRINWALLLAALFAGGVLLGAAQEGPVTPVEFTEASSYRLGTRVELPGTVESLRLSQIASQVDGLVEELLVREGEKVEQGQVLARLDTDTLEARRNTLEAQLLEAQARLRSADTRLRRARELFEAEVISEEQFDDARYEWEALKANVESLKASVEEIDVQLRQSVIKAPFRGAVTAKLTEIGQWVGAGDPVVELLALDALEVTVDVPEIHVGKIRLGQGARVRLEALPNRPLNGRVSAVVPRASQDTRTFPVKVAISALNGQVRTGMLASVSLVPSDPRQATIVPKDGLVASGTGWMVFTINGDNTVSPVEVEPGEGIGQWVEVRGDVRPGDRIVTRGNERLQPGQTVQPARREYELP